MPKEPELVEAEGRVAAQYGEVLLRSHFQPIFSISHRRVVGHEALLRARDAHGRPVAPPALFERCRSADELRRLDWLASLTHCSNFARARRSHEWLFLNVHPGTFDSLAQHASYDLESLFLKHVGVPARQVVIEVLEHAIGSGTRFEEEIARLRSLGCLISLDDFGAGHSNFDRVWRLKPDIVKLDRSVVERAARDRSVRRVASQMVTMLHECGALVLMEGVETQDEAHVALDSDADFVQGFLFGRPADLPIADDGQPCATLEQAWRQFDVRSAADHARHHERLAPYRQAIMRASRALCKGQAPELALGSFLALPGAQMGYLLDAQGFQVGRNITRGHNGVPAPAVMPAHPDPLGDTRHARWSRRPYFRRAVESPGSVQATRPYLNMQSSQLCVTLSVSYCVRGQTLIVCGDIVWDDIVWDE